MIPGIILSSLYQTISGNDSAAAAHDNLVGDDDSGMGCEVKVSLPNTVPEVYRSVINTDVEVVIVSK